MRKQVGKVGKMERSTINSRCPATCLVYDENVAIRPIGAFRVRIWLAIDLAPIVLMSQLPDNPHPEFTRTRIAQKVWTQLLHYPALKPQYYEIAPDGKLRWLEITWIGNVEDRMAVWRATSHPVCWSELEALVNLTCQSNPEDSSVNFSVKGE